MQAEYRFMEALEGSLVTYTSLRWQEWGTPHASNTPIHKLIDIHEDSYYLAINKHGFYFN